MLHDFSLPKSLRAEAFNTVTYVHNRTPTKGMGGRTPFEVLCEAKPDVSTLYAIVEPTERLRKLDDRATMCSFVGSKYEGGSYRVWDLKRRVVVESRDLASSATWTRRTELRAITPSMWQDEQNTPLEAHQVITNIESKIDVESIENLDGKRRRATSTSLISFRRNSCGLSNLLTIAGRFLQR